MCLIYRDEAGSLSLVVTVLQCLFIFWRMFEKPPSSKEDERWQAAAFMCFMVYIIILTRLLDCCSTGVSNLMRPKDSLSSSVLAEKEAVLLVD
jgi:hypothetical protein